MLIILWLRFQPQFHKDSSALTPDHSDSGLVLFCFMCIYTFNHMMCFFYAVYIFVAYVLAMVSVSLHVVSCPYVLKRFRINCVMFENEFVNSFKREGPKLPMFHSFFINPYGVSETITSFFKNSFL